MESGCLPWHALRLFSIPACSSTALRGSSHTRSATLDLNDGSSRLNLSPFRGESELSGDRRRLHGFGQFGQVLPTEAPGRPARLWPSAISHRHSRRSSATCAHGTTGREDLLPAPPFSLATPSPRSRACRRTRRCRRRCQPGRCSSSSRPRAWPHWRARPERDARRRECAHRQ